MRDRTTYGLCWSPSLLGDVIPPPTPFCHASLSDTSMCSSHIPALSLTDNLVLPKVSSFVSPPNCGWPRCVICYIWWTGGGGTEWTCKEITVREVEQQQCTDYRQDLCEEHMISSLIPLSDWPWWRGSSGWDRRERESGFGFIRTEPDQDREWW